MAHPDQSPLTALVADVDEPHQSAVAAILHACLRGEFSADEAGLLIDRIRARSTDRSIEDGLGRWPDGADPSERPDRTPP